MCIPDTAEAPKAKRTVQFSCTARTVAPRAFIA